MTIYCEKEMIGNVVEIKLAKNVDTLNLCEVKIFGGRHLSFNKQTLPKETLHWEGFWNSSYAVDGRQMRQGENQDVESERTCMATKQTKSKTTHQWSVNLDTEYLIQGIHFFGRYGQLAQSMSYEIYVHGNYTLSHEPVFTDIPAGNHIGDYNPKSVNFTNPVFGLEIQVQRRNARILVICELEVFGECPLGKCGWDCEKVCMCKSQTTGFAKIEGWCPYGCKGRWSGHNGTCNIECSNTQWGPKCNKTCGKCKNNDYCNASDGACPNSCEPGWIPPLCIQECNNNTYGDDCNFTCGHCKHDLACNKQNGECTDGCSPGYKQPLCNQECDPHWYGKNCSESCGKCHGGDSCDHVTGYCPADCDAGYQGQNCQSFCSSQFYGMNCSKTCGSCANSETCDPINGECQNGCSPGWITIMCNKKCDPHWYGKNCSESCGKCHGGDSCDHVTGYCPADCDAGYKGQDCQSIIDTKEQGDARSPTGIIVGAVIAVSIILIIILACFIYKYKSNRNAGMSDKRTQPMLTNESIEVNDEIVTSKKKNGEAKLVAQNQPDDLGTGKKEKKESAIKLSSFRTYSKQVKSEPTKLYDEFNELPYGLKHDASEAEAVEHKPKNRYKDMYPYNANRVILPKIEEKPESTYINASYIDGYHFPRKYIAAQGALKTTVNDMWRMMWSQDANVIIMLTNCIEIGKIKCVQYWPESGTETYGDIQVELVSVEEYSDFKIRMFLATETDSGEHRSIVQFHYTAWPDKSVPDSALSLVQFWRKVRGHEKADKFPWVVHCSAGVGRTGTFIALDYLYDQGKSKNVVDVKDCVNTLRKQRLNMVQTKEQYLYLCEAGAESLTPIGAVHRKEEFLAICTELISATGSHALRAEFDSINDDTDIDTETVEALYNNTQDPVEKQRNLSAFREENIPKSRDITIVPDDLHRPMLTLAVKGRNDFINAVFVSTYRKTDRMILTQFPLKDTVVDFVRMIWQLDIKTLVLLEDTVTAEGVYWPTTEVPRAISPFKVILLNDVRHEYCTIRTIRYSFLQNDNEQQKDVKMFHFRAWPSFEKTPESTSSFIQLMSEIEADR
ncbi:receptor-type tyrosine-protein phosphatase epsilon-like isoform X2 [Ruditapes philippinarum]|uniref:receptor-type tyrosine-protein phosphatase epsilon-like isoform X2 n=1 Tax=Ruditapes philippinarum TaxID=129788 RepID=UPI00295B7E82|nr:receptor-type tyrosine-protein phosphatase epsilon-like isoform X2 [Ruditapes philippinarum]